MEVSHLGGMWLSGLDQGSHIDKMFNIYVFLILFFFFFFAKIFFFFFFFPSVLSISNYHKFK
jgi:hypothetical protein